MLIRTLRALVVGVCLVGVALFSSHAVAHAQDTTFDQFALASPAQNVAVDGAGRAWYTLPAANRLASVTPAGVVTYYPANAADMPADGQPYDLVINGDEIWFTLIGTNQIGRFNTVTSALAFYTIPTADSQPTGISSGGGYVWFVERAGDKLGRLNPGDGSIVEFYNWVVDDRNPVDMRDAELEDVAWASGNAANPQGVVWIVGPKLSTSVAVYKVAEERFIPSPVSGGSAPMQIVVDSQDNVWATFSGQLGGRYVIGRSALNTLGQWDFYILPDGPSGPVGLFVRDQGDRRQLWYTRPGSNHVGYVLVSSTSNARLGVWETVSPLANSAPWGIAVDAAGNAFIAASGAPNALVWNAPYFESFLYLPYARQ